MPKTIAQWTGFAVTVIIALGRDADVLTAIPLGIATGMLATLFQTALRMQPWPMALAAVDLRRPLVVAANAVLTYRPKRRQARLRQ